MAVCSQRREKRNFFLKKTSVKIALISTVLLICDFISTSATAVSPVKSNLPTDTDYYG